MGSAQELCFGFDEEKIRSESHPYFMVFIVWIGNYDGRISKSVVLVQCIPIELLSTYFTLPHIYVVFFQCMPHRAVINLLQPASIQCGVGPAYPHREIVNPMQFASIQCGVGPVCAP